MAATYKLFATVCCIGSNANHAIALIEAKVRWYLAAKVSERRIVMAA
jgi:hypothetical protein